MKKSYIVLACLALIAAPAFAESFGAIRNTDLPEVTKPIRVEANVSVDKQKLAAQKQKQLIQKRVNPPKELWKGLKEKM